MDRSHLNKCQLKTKHQKYKGRVVLRGDIVRDNSGSYVGFNEEGSSASQMTGTEVMDIISRLPGCAGQAAGAVSAKTQVEMEDVHKLSKIPKSECPDISIRLPRHKWLKSWSIMEDPVVHFSSAVSSDTMSKRSQHGSSDERVTAESRPNDAFHRAAMKRLHQRSHLLHQKAW